jgi:Protein of unknown function (DUF2868)
MPPPYHRAMRNSAPPNSLLIDSIAIPAWLEADREQPYEERAQRDRAIAATTASDPLTRVREWWRQVRHTPGFNADESEGAIRLLRARQLLTLLMMATGLLAGIAATTAVFHYDGRWPVNVVTVLATLVLLQLILVILTLVLMLPHVPGVALIQNALASFNPGALAAAAFRRLIRRDDTGAHLHLFALGPATSRFMRWQMLAWSQSAAVAFNLAALATVIVLIAFTDLAFGWSTTLRVDSAEVLQITQTLAAPWRAFWPTAVPDAALIESSRYFRLATAPSSGVPASELTGWWPFLLASIITYGLLPRCCLLFVATWRLRAATRRLLLDDPRVRALLDRMNMPEVQLGSHEVEVSAMFADDVQAHAAPSLEGEAVAIIWSDAIERESIDAWTRQHLRRQVASVLEAGARTLAADQATVVRAATLQPSLVLIFVRAWEAPLMDLQDFIHALRAGVGTQRSLVVVPIGANCVAADAIQRATWSRWIARIGDPALYLESGA